MCHPIEEKYLFFKNINRPIHEIQLNSVNWVMLLDKLQRTFWFVLVVEICLYKSTPSFWWINLSLVLVSKHN